jgi:acetoin utilization protein AcuB
MRVRDWMTGPVRSVRPEENLHDAEALMRQYYIRHLPVLYRGTLVGILSDRDLQSALPSPTTTLSVGEIRFYLARLQVSQVMTRQVLTITPQMPLAEATRLVHDRKLGALPVIAGGQVVGILTTTDLMEALGVLLQQAEKHQYALH